MDWSAVVMLVAERTGLAALILGRGSELLLASPAAEHALGMGPQDLGSNWFESHALPSARASARWHIERVMVGSIRRLDVPLLTTRGPALVSFDACPVGGTQGGAMLVLDGLRAIAEEEPLADYDYEVSAVSSGAPTLISVRAGGASEAKAGHCFEVLHGRSSPCQKCPLFTERTVEAPTVSVRSRSPDHYVVTTASIKGDGARITVRSISSSSLAAVLAARMDQLSERARLSKRERSVFGHLMDGRAVEDIANELQISRRTVKFHQANVLKKLGADSRIDLLRLVF